MSGYGCGCEHVGVGEFDDCVNVDVQGTVAVMYRSVCGWLRVAGKLRMCDGPVWMWMWMLACCLMDVQM